MSEAVIYSNNWTFIYESLPEFRKTVLVFRQKNKKYIVAFLSKNDNKEEDREENDYDWTTQQNLCYPVDEDDLWFEFPFVKIEQIFDGLNK